MIFKVNKQTTKIEIYSSSWQPKELEVENYLLPSTASDDPILNPDVFKEPLLLIKNQVRTKNKKRADILALDRVGNAVIIELKKDRGQLGVETQALQYLAEFSAYKGKNFVAYFSKYAKLLEDNIRGFVGDNVRLEDINKYSRIILMAQRFDPSLFSMGKWLASCDVAFRCVEYTPFEIDGEHYLSFSIAFDQSPSVVYPLAFQSQLREPQYFWHNIGRNTQDWWQYLYETGQISTGFSNQPGDEGERILKNYIQGDTIVAYATGYGAVGWGIIEKPETYKLLRPGSTGDRLQGAQLHRLNIRWKYVAEKLEDGLSANSVRSEFGIYHPVSTSVSIDSEKAKRLIIEMDKKLQKVG